MLKERKEERKEKKENHGKIATCEQQFSVTAETGSNVTLGLRALTSASDTLLPL